MASQVLLCLCQARLCFHGLGAPSPSHEQGLPLTPPPLRYFGPLASSMPASLPSSLPLEPSPQLFSIALPQSIFPRPLPACSSSCLQSLAPFFVSIFYTSLLVFLIFLSPSNPFPKFLPQAPSISLSLSLALSPPFSLPCSPHLCLPPLAPHPPAFFLQWGKWLGREGEKEGEGEMGTHGVCGPIQRIIHGLERGRDKETETQRHGESIPRRRHADRAGWGK